MKSVWEWSGIGNFTNATQVLTVPSVSVTNPATSTTTATMFYARAVGTGPRAIWQTSRVTVDAPFPTPGAAVPELAEYTDAAPQFVSDDGCRLYFTALNRIGGKGGQDYWLASRGK